MRFRNSIVAVALAASLVTSARADLIHWINPENGVFPVSANWSTGVVPGVGDTAVFDLDSVYTVSVLNIAGESPLVDRLVFHRGDVTLHMVNGSLSADWSSGIVPAVIVSELDGDVALVRLTAGADDTSDLNVTSIGAGWETGANGTLEIAGEEVEVAVEAEVTLGVQGHGTLRLLPNSLLEANRLIAGWGLTGVGAVECDGADIEVAEEMLFGVNGQSSTTITGGGRLSADSVGLGIQPAGTATMMITGPGSVLVCDGFLDAGVAGSAELRIEDGGRLWVLNDLILGFLPEDAAGNPAGTGALWLDGDASRVSVLGDLWVGMLGHGEIRIAHDARVDVIGGLKSVSFGSEIAIELAEDNDFGSAAITASSEFDPVDVVVTLAKGYTPSIGARFELLRAGTALATPSPILPALPGGRQWHIDQTSTTLAITMVGDPDLDGNNAVGFNDLLILLGAWGVCPGGACAADLNGDHVVDFADLLIVLAAWS